jgi:hypothetical protein
MATVKVKSRSGTNITWLPFSVFAVLAFISLRLIEFNGLYGQDGHEYYRMFRELSAFIQTGTEPYLPFFPVYYSLTGAILSFGQVQFPEILQAVSIISLTAAGYFLTRIILLLFPGNSHLAAIYTVLFYLLCPIVLVSGVLVMSDAAAVALIMASVYFFVSYYNGRTHPMFSLQVLFSVAAILTRTPAAIILVPFLISGTILFLGDFSWKWVILTAVCVFILLIPDLYLRNRLLFYDLDSNSVTYLKSHPGWSVFNFFRTSFHKGDGSISYKYPNLVYAFSNFWHPSYLAGGVVLFILSVADIRRSRLLILFSSGLFIYLFFLAGLQNQNMRFLLLSYPFFLIISFPGAVFIYSKLKPSFRKIVFIVIPLVQLFMFARLFSKYLEINRTETAICNYINKLPSNTIYTFAFHGPLQSYCPEFKVVSLYDSVLTMPVEPGYLVFNEGKYYEQFRDENPVINLELIKKRNRVSVIKRFSSGEIVYMIDD